MGVTVGVMLEEIQALYKQHQQPCFLYLSSEVIKVLIYSTSLESYFYRLPYISYIWKLFQIFGSDPSCTSYLKALIESLFNNTTYMFTKIQVRV